MKAVSPIEKGTRANCTPLLVALIGLAILEIICFFPSLKETGFYLDDWVFLSIFKSGPSDFWQAFHNLLAVDPRFINRPLEAILFLTSYKCFGMNPLGYHLSYAVMEVISAWLLYLVLSRIGKSRLTAFLASAVFLLMPTHNASHYWVSCICVGLSLCLFCGSLLADSIGAVKRSIIWHVISCLLFILSIFNYELFLPLIVLNIFIVVKTKSDQGDSLVDSIKGAVPTALMFMGSIMLLLFYLKIVVPKIGKTWTHEVKLDPILMFNTVAEGIKLHMPSYFLEHFGKILNSTFSSGLSLMQMLSIFGIAITIVIVSVYQKSQESDDYPDSLRSGLAILFAGIISFVASFTIFGLNHEYFPTYLTLVNRINTGAAISVAFIVSGTLLLLRYILNQLKTRSSTTNVLLIVPIIVLSTYFCTVNWALARPYILSWQVQSHIAKFLKENKTKLKTVKSMFIANAPTYADEAPVFDGVWDFEPMARIMLDRDDLQGGAITDRLRFLQGKDYVQDYSGTFLCATYQFDELYILFSPECELVKVESPKQFIDLIESRGLKFKRPDLAETWRKQLN